MSETTPRKYSEPVPLNTKFGTVHLNLQDKDYIVANAHEAITVNRVPYRFRLDLVNYGTDDQEPFNGWERNLMCRI